MRNKYRSKGNLNHGHMKKDSVPTERATVFVEHFYTDNAPMEWIFCFKVELFIKLKIKICYLNN